MTRYLPADADLLTGWCVPYDVFLPHPDTGLTRNGRWVSAVSDGSAPPTGTSIRLDLHRPEVQALLIHWLTVGERCPACSGGAVDFRGRALGNGTDGSCADCHGTGHLRAPADVRHILPRSLVGALDDADNDALSAWEATGYKVDADESPAGPLLAHGYRPEHGDPVVWAAEQIEEATATIRELRADLATLRALNTTLLDALRSLGETFSIRRWILGRIFGRT